MILIAVLGFIVGVITGAAALAGFAMWPPVRLGVLDFQGLGPGLKGFGDSLRLSGIRRSPQATQIQRPRANQIQIHVKLPKRWSRVGDCHDGDIHKISDWAQAPPWQY
jgi:hypothetical protein